MVSRDLLSAVHAHLTVRGWTSGICVSCGKGFLAPVSRTDCGDEVCAPPRPTNVRRCTFADQVWPVARWAFQEYRTTTRTDLINHLGGTRFVGAGLQIFEPAIFAEAVVPTGPLFVPQPAIRLNHLDTVVRSDGFSTAFVNLCSEQAHADLADYMKHLDRWLACLAKLGVADAELTLLLPSELWIGGPFRGTSLVVTVVGVEIGDLVWIDYGDAAVGRLLPIVDASFGLERMTAALNTDLGYTALLGPLPASLDPPIRTVLDRLRTAVLLLMSGLEPSGRGRGRTLRQLITTSLPPQARCEVDTLVRHAFGYWSTFHTTEASVTDCVEVVRRERERDRNRSLLAGTQRNGAAAVKLTTDEIYRRILLSGVDGSLSFGSVHLPPAVPLDPRQELTVVVPTSPIPSHPSSGMLRRALRSLVVHAGLNGCRLLMVCDGAPPNSGSVADYDEYKRRLRKLAADDQLGFSTKVIALEDCAGLGGVVRTALNHVTTPYLLMWEHDWRLIRPVAVGAMLGLFNTDSGVHYVRLNKRATHEAGWDSVLKPDDRCRQLPLTRTGCWSANPHIARTEHYRRFVVPQLRPEPNGGSMGFEHPVFHAYQAAIHELGFDRAQRRWGVFILGLLGEPPYVTHMDGRGSVSGISTGHTTRKGIAWS